MRSPIRRRRGTGFTLVEMLITIAIVGMLAALLVPAINGARAKADQSKCIANLRSLATGVLAYAGDNDGQLPQEYNSVAPLGGTGRNRWNLQIAPYVGYDDMQTAAQRPPFGDAKQGARRFPTMFCPACSASWLGKSWFLSDYTPNGRFITNAGTGSPPLRVAAIVNPSQKILLAENGSLGNPLNSGNAELSVNNLILTGGYSVPTTAQATRQSDLGFRHPPVRSGSLANSVCHVAFADGRIEGLKPNDPRLATLEARRLLLDPLASP